MLLLLVWVISVVEWVQMITLVTTLVVFCCVSTLTLGNSIELSPRNTATNVRHYGAEARKLYPKNKV